MTTDRSQAYGRVLATLADVGPSKLTAAEQDIVRESADALCFCADLATDDAAQFALADVRALADRLVESGRWLRDTATRLSADVEACGPAPAPARVSLPAAA
jgi:hypothetical protein